MKEKINNILKKFLFIIRNNICFLILLFFNIYTISYISHRMHSAPPKFLCGFIILLILADIVYLINQNKISKESKIEKIFLLMTVPLGLLYVFFIPVFAGTDEPMHFFRAYQVSDGYMIKTQEYNVMIPTSLHNLHYRTVLENYESDFLFEKLNKSDKVLMPQNNAALNYSPIQYIPQIIGIKLGLLLNFNPMIIVLLCRILSFFLWVFIIYNAIKIFPYNKILFLFTVVAPSVLSLVSTTTGDTILFALSFYYIALILKFIKSKEKVSCKWKIALFIISLLLSLCKTVYILLCILLLLLSNENFKSRKDRFIFLFLTFVFSIGVDIGWNVLIPSTSEVVNNSQLYYIISNPITYILTIFRTFIERFYYYFVNFFSGNEMCYGRANIPSLVSLSYVIVIYLSMKYNDFKEIKFKNKIIIWLVFILLVGAVSTSMYILWTPVVADYAYYMIEGVQSRYIVMMVPLILLLFKPKVAYKFSKEQLIKFYVCLNYVCFICCISSLIVRYY